MAPPTLLVLGDPHGYWRYAAAILAAWRDAHGHPPTVVLCVGDTGYFPDPAGLDRATRRHGERDPEQLQGLTRLLDPAGDPVVEALLGSDTPTVHAVAGNHEDHGRLLARARALRTPVVPLDPRGRLAMLRDGVVTTLGPWRIASVWGIQPAPGRRRTPVPGRHLDPAAAERLRGEPFDILLTHEAPETAALPLSWPPGTGPGGTGTPHPTVGSPALRALLERRPGALQLFGHYHFSQGHDLAVGPSRALQLSILRPRCAAAAVAITGSRGSWSATRLGDDPAWSAALEQRVALLPPGSTGPIAP